jgi:hypothetical protein
MRVLDDDEVGPGGTRIHWQQLAAGGRCSCPTALTPVSHAASPASTPAPK